MVINATRNPSAKGEVLAPNVQDKCNLKIGHENYPIPEMISIVLLES